MSRTSLTLILAATGAAGIALPAAAQTGLCGGTGTNGQWIGGSEAASDVATSSDYLEQMALVLMGNEYVSLFSVSTPTPVRVEAAGRSGGDPVIDLRNATGDIVLSDDDSGGEGSARGEMQLDPGTYCLSMSSYDGAPMTGFVRIGRQDQEALTAGTGVPVPPPTDPVDPTDPATDPADPPTDAVVPGGPGCTGLSNYFADGGPVDVSLGSGGASVTAPVDRVDAWGFTLAAPSAITLTATNLDADPYITLYDTDGNYLGENDDFDGLDSRLDMTSPLPAGGYCVEVAALSDTAAPITVTVQGYDANAALIGQYERGEASPPLDGSYPVTALGPLGNRLRHDVQATSDTTWLSFDIDQPSLVLVEGVSNGVGDPIMVVYDDFGRLVAENDDYGGDLDPLVAARVSRGTYLVGVRQLNEGETGIVRILFERYMPAQ